MSLTNVANHKYLKFLFLLPIAIMIAVSMYFYHLAHEIDIVMHHARVVASQAQIAELTFMISELTHISTWINVGSLVLIVSTTILNVGMVLMIISLSNRQSYRNVRCDRSVRCEELDKLE